MAHPYGTEEQLRTEIGRDLAVRLSQLEGSNAASVYAQVRENADNWIDSKLAQKFSVPFAAITDTPATPGIVNTLSNYRAAQILMVKRFADSKRAKFYADEIKDMLADLLNGDADIPGAAKVSAAAGRTGIAYQARTPAFGMVQDTDTDDETLSDSVEGVF